MSRDILWIVTDGQSFFVNSLGSVVLEQRLWQVQSSFFGREQKKCCKKATG